MSKLCFPLFLLLALAIVGCSPAESDVQQAAANGTDSLVVLSAAQMEAAGITVGSPQQKNMSTYLECSGQVDVPPYSLASVYAPTQGFVQQVQHLPGDFVKKGARLTTISHPDLVRLQRELLECKSRLHFLEKDYQRKLTLADEDATSQRTLELAQADFQFETARYQGLRAELGMLGFNLVELEREGKIQTSLPLYAPISGYLTKVEVNNGKLVAPTDLLYEIVDPGHIHVELQVFAKDITRVQAAQRIECSLPGSNQTYLAEVHLVGSVVDPERKTVMVHGHFLQEPVPLKPGSFLQARIFTTTDSVWCVPDDAIVRNGASNAIFIQTPAGFLKREVAVGRSDQGFTELIQADPNWVLALTGAYYLNAGVPDPEEEHSH